jgi:glutaredoxin-like protein DUF836
VGQSEGAPTVTLYTRAGCHLCEEAERVLAAERDPELRLRYGVRVPVVAVDGEELFEYQVPADLLRARLRRSRVD